MAHKLTLKEIDAEIAKLQQQAEGIRASEKAEVVARMKEAVAYYGITAGDLGLGALARKWHQSGDKAVRGNGPGKRKAKAGTGQVKYKDSAGHTWSGHGRRPRWYTEALASGKTEAELRA